MNLRNIYASSELKDEKGRIYYFDNLKFILIFLVVLGHFLDPITAKSSYAKSIWLYIYFFHMPLFIFISGYFAKKAVAQKDTNKIFNFIVLYVLLVFICFSINKFYYKGTGALNLLTVKSIPWYLFAMAVWYGWSIITRDWNKKKLLIFSIIFALIIGYSKEFKDFLCLSRIFVFYPFFLLGIVIKEEYILKIINNKKNKIISMILLIVVFIAFIMLIDKIYFIRPITTARNSYYSLENSIENFGAFFRIIWYIGSSVMSVLFMAIIPVGKTFFSKLGKRTLAVYFLHSIVITIFLREKILLRVYQYFIISIFVTFILSLKIFSIIFDRIMKMKMKIN